MSTLVDKPHSATYRDGKVHLVMESGLEISFPVRGNPRLEGKPEKQLNNIELAPFGLHWPDLDEDLSIKGILGGNYGQKPREAA